MNINKRIRHLDMFVRLIKQARINVYIYLFIKLKNINELSDLIISFIYNSAFNTISSYDDFS